MKVKIHVEFEVPDAEDERIAKAAASVAAWEYLAFCTAIGVNAGREECRVHVDGAGEYTVKIGEDHD